MAKTAKVIIGEKERTLAFPIMSLIKLKKEFGIQLKDLQDEEKAQDMETILAIIYAGLIHEDKELDFEELGYMIDITDLPEISQKLSEVFKGMNEKNLQK
jgi:hypothetical protein